ncbi:MAG: glutamate 5-kinase [Thermodesulfobacterium sp.]|jgi:glutamate 5-kinase|nr:glutamate 5-kinase [Thermodesulfobacterium sp.]
MLSKGFDRKRFVEEVFAKSKRVVVKVGSAVLTKDDEGLNWEVLDQIAFEISRLRQAGKQVLLISSGAIACGRSKLKLFKKPLSLSEKQALAACGQADLIHAYEEVFKKYQTFVAQVLLTSQDLAERERYLNARNTLNTLLKWGVLPIINENDTVATEEIRFSDNDFLSALVAGSMQADLLIVLSDVSALFEKDPREDPSAKPIRYVEEINEEVLAMAGSKPGRVGRGGMFSKLKAAQMVTSMGIPMVLLPGREKLILERFFAGEVVGTIFFPKERSLPLRKFWIKYILKPEGRITIDKGAERAILFEGKSLLLPGLKEVDGEFKKGACLLVLNEEKVPIGKGLSNFSSEELSRFLHEKEKQDKELIHRDNFVPLDIP